MWMRRPEPAVTTPDDTHIKRKLKAVDEVYLWIMVSWPHHETEVR
jgi:hypothetical protein